jgi:glycosyltransferase involved in cell wall biosynthesis
MRLYAGPGRRRILPPLIFGTGVLLHLVRHRHSYDVVHTASFPFFSLLAAGVARRFGRYLLFVDWFEVWTLSYWMAYLGPIRGRIGHAVQALCARTPHVAFCFSQLHALRLTDSGYQGEPRILQGLYDGPREAQVSELPEPIVMFAGRHIPEKRVPALVLAIARLRGEGVEVRAAIFGDGPEQEAVRRLVEEMNLREVISLTGFVDAEAVENALRGAACMVLPSSREGYGMIVIEAAAAGTPSVVVRAEDNAATELIEEGVNGFVAASAAPADLAAAISRALAGGHELRRSTAAWFRRNATRLSLESSLERVLAAYTHHRFWAHSARS